MTIRTGIGAGAAVVDQVLVASTTFGINVALARLGTPSDYGAFVLAYSAIVLATEVQHSVVVEPLLVLGSGRTGLTQVRYISAALTLQVGLAGLLVATVLLGTVLVWVAGASPALVPLLAAMALALLGLQGREFLRKAQYACERPFAALGNDMVYSVVLVTLLLWPVDIGLTGPRAFTCMGVAGLISTGSGLWHARLWPSLDRGELRQAFDANWSYGRWLLGSSAARWASSDAYYFGAALFIGAAGAGALKAIQNVFTPIGLMLAGLGNLLLPQAARSAEIPAGLARLTLRASVGFGLVAAGYVLLVTLSSPAVISLLYGSGSYEQYAGLLTILGLGHVVVALLQGPSLGVRALHASLVVFAASVAGAIAAIATVAPLAAVWGVPGAALAWVLGQLAAAPIWIWGLRSGLRRSAATNT